MTSQVSLTVNKKQRAFNPGQHAFRQGLREGAAVTVINAVLFAAVSVITLIGLLGRYGTGTPEYASLKYCFFNGTFFSMIFPAIALELALLQGLLAFRFLFSRKSANAWFSVGISRSTLFRARFAAGAVGAVLPVVLGMVASLVINLALFSDTGLVLARFSFFTLGMGVQVLALYCVAVAVCTASATIVEGVAYSAVIAALPTVLFMGMNGLMVRFLSGNSYGVSDQMYFIFSPALLKALSDWNPLILMTPYIERYAGASTDADIAAYLASLPPLPINWLAVLGWAAASLALAWLAQRLFQARKVERAGVLGSGKVVGYIPVLTVVFFAFCTVFIIPLNVTQDMPTATMLAIAVAAALAASLALVFPLKLVGRPLWKGLLPAAGGVAAMLALVGILATGGLGFSSFVPEAGDIKSVSLSYNGLGYYLPTNGSGGGGSALFSEISLDCSVKLTDQADIDVARQIHQSLADAGSLALSPRGYADPDKVYNIITKISYTLTDGRVVTRAYHGLTSDLMKGMFRLDSAGGVKKAFADYILKGSERPGVEEPNIFADGDIYLCDAFYRQVASVKLDDAKRGELLQCVVDDLSAQDPADRYLPQEPAKYILKFLSERDDPQQSIIFGGSVVYLTGQFKRTLSFLENNSLTAELAQAGEIEYMSVIDYNADSHYNDYNPGYTFPIFFNSLSTQQDIDRYKQYKGLNYFITDSGQQQEVLAHSHSMYYAGDGGYVVVMKFKGQEKYVSAFLPKKDAPDYVKQGVK